MSTIITAFQPFQDEDDKRGYLWFAKDSRPGSPVFCERRFFDLYEDKHLVMSARDRAVDFDQCVKENLAEFIKNPVKF